MEEQWWLRKEEEVDEGLKRHNENAADLDCIIEHLYLGAFTAASNPVVIEAYGIQAIINATKEMPEIKPDVKEYKQIPIWDEEDEKIAIYFKEATKFIHEHV